MNLRNTSIPALTLLTGVCLMGGAAAALADGFTIRNSDKVVIYGDSITAGSEYQGYPRYLEAYIRTRFPKWTTLIWNRGWSGETAANLDRFKRDCLSLKPDVILFNMGMNDAGFSPEIAPGLRNFVENIASTVALAREANPQVRMVLISPILYESRAPGAVSFYPYVLRSYAREERELARRLNLPYIDLNLEYGQTVGLAEGIFPSSIIFSGDGIHPTPAGGCLFIACHILKGLGASADLASVHIDAETRKVVAAAGAQVELVPDQGAAISFDRTLSALPFPVVESANGVTYRDRAVAFLVEVADDLNRDMLKVTGLPAKAYALRIDDKTIAELSADELADGINLSRFFQTPDQNQAVAVSEAVGQKQIVQDKLWRLGLEAKDHAPIPSGLEAELGKAVAAMQKISQPARHRFTLAPLEHEMDRYRTCEQLLQISGPPTLTAGEDGILHQEIKVVVNNLSLRPRRVEFFWNGNGVTPSAMVSELAAGEQKEVPFALTVTAGDLAPRLMVKHQPLDLSFPPLVQEYAPILMPHLDVPRASVPIKVDGIPAEWTGAAQIDFEKRLTPETGHHRAGPGDFSAQAQVFWNEQSLAIAISVRDQDHVSHFTDDRLGWDDAVTVTAGDKSYTLALTGNGPAIQPENAPAGGVLFAVKRQGLETIYELEIPAQAIAGKKLEAGTSYPFDVTICDRDRDESHKVVNWCGSLVQPQQPGRIRLMGATASSRSGLAAMPAVSSSICPAASGQSCWNCT